MFVEALRAEQVMCGWLRATGVLTDVELRAFPGERGGLGASRTLVGPVQVVLMEGGVGIQGAEVSLSMRAVLSRDTEWGPQTFAGEIVRARAVAVEAMITLFDDLALERSVDSDAGILLFTPLGGPTAAAARPVASATTWAAVAEASAESDRDATVRLRPGSPGGAMPAAPVRARLGEDIDAPVPETGDVVDHFAFGRCDVVKSDGDRLHLRVGKEGRIREIALEMLRVTLLGELGDKRHFKLERRM